MDAASRGVQVQAALRVPSRVPSRPLLVGLPHTLLPARPCLRLGLPARAEPAAFLPPGPGLASAVTSGPSMTENSHAHRLTGQAWSSCRERPGPRSSGGNCGSSEHDSQPSSVLSSRGLERLSHLDQPTVPWWERAGVSPPDRKAWDKLKRRRTLSPEDVTRPADTHLKDTCQLPGARTREFRLRAADAWSVHSRRTPAVCAS